MAQLKAQLEAAGYDTSGLDEAGILSQLDQAGYDTSSFGAPEPKESKAKGFVRKAAGYLPAAGGVVGGTVGGVGGTAFGMGVGGLPGAVGGAGLGAATGEAAKQLILRGLGDTEGVPQTSTEAAKEIGKKGVTDAAITAAGGLALGGAVKGAKFLASPGKEVVETALQAELAPLKNELAQLAETKAGLPATIIRRKRELRAGVKDFGKMIGEAEKEMGINVDVLPKLRAAEIATKEGAKDFIESVGKLASKTPEELQAIIPASERNILRKMGEQVQFAGQGTEKLGNVQFEKGLQRIGESLDLDSPAFKAGRAGFKQSKEGLEGLIDEARLKKATVEEASRKVGTKMRTIQETGSKNIAKAARRDQTKKQIIAAALAAGGLGGLGAFLNR